ncbi:MAG: hypothetical protein AB2L24_19380 [Mangrovibacterium sp.]
MDPKIKILSIMLCGAFHAFAQAPKPPVPVPFRLASPGYVTLVIERSDGTRIRNLVSETWFPAGKDTAWWDGMDDLGRDVDAADHGVYSIPSHFADPGIYKVRGLVRGEITPRYEFSPYTTGTPPWNTADHTGAWLANHTPPMAAVFLPSNQSPAGQPMVMLGCYVTEGPDGLAWVDLEGKKLGGKKWIGGNWTAAPYLARDAGKKAISGYKAYVASVWETGKQSGILELRVTALTSDKDKPVVVHILGPQRDDSARAAEIGGLAVYNGLVVVSLPLKNQLILIDGREGKVIGDIPLEAPKGLAFDANGRLLALTGKKLVRFNPIADPAKIFPPRIIIPELLSPCSLTLDENGNLYISDRGDSHQVKVFSSEGKFIRAIGNPGVPKAGPYDPLHMNNPAGLTIDSRQQLWVTEQDYLPKRVSVWSLDGKLLKAFYGPGKYGGGGTLDPQDKTKFYYSDEGRGAMEFRLDWEKGTSQLVRVYYRPAPGDMKMAFRSAAPETPLYHKGRRYFTNCYNSSPTNGHPTAFLFAERNGIAVPVAAMGQASSWDVLKSAEFAPHWPEGVDLNAQKPATQAFFIWTDNNGDARVQPEEVQFRKASAGGVTVLPDLSFCIARVDDQAMKFDPVGFSAQGNPQYDIGKGKVLAEGVLPPASSGGNQVLTTPEGWTIITLGINPFSRYSISGAKNAAPAWSYPNVWPGLHASHKAPKPDRPGQIIGPTRLLGGFIEAKNSDAGKILAVNGNHGNIYLFTSDGLFVATLFDDMRIGQRWTMPVAERGMVLENITLNDENFWPTITQTSDGEVYLVDGGRSALIHLDGFENIRRLPETSVSLTAADIEKSRAYLLETEATRQKSYGNKVLKVSISGSAPVVDGKLDEWTSADWVDIDKSGVKAYFNANTKPYDVAGAITVSGDRLYLAYRTGNAKLLTNSREMPVAPFKTGGALDLMIGVNPEAKPDRQNPVAGDSRLLVTIVDGKPWALLYRAVVDGTLEKDKIPFSSPWRTITFDSVQDVSSQIRLEGSDGNFELSVPLRVLGLNLREGLSIKGDIGILRGEGNQTTARIYWSNKATGITADVPSEAMLTPALWGTFNFAKDPGVK